MSLIVLCVFMIIGAAMSRNLDFNDDSDLAKFVSRPDLRSPKFNVTTHNANQVSQGYWFIDPYDNLKENQGSPLYTPAQIGPHIYDNQGDLVWSGAPLFHPRTTFDFKATTYENNTGLSFIVHNAIGAMEHPGGAGIIMDNTYSLQGEAHTSGASGLSNMHEFNVLDGGKTALMLLNHPQLHEIPGVGAFQPMAFVDAAGFQELDLQTGESVFEWTSLDHVPINATYVAHPQLPNNIGSSWDWFHSNSVDKNAQGDYLLSSRYTNCIYKISGADGSIIWKLGGKDSSFTLDGFNFSSQHDARFREENSTTTIISFLNNASDGTKTTADHSSALLVALHTSVSPMRAEVIQNWARPDGKLTHLRGNVQILPDTNVFVSWSSNGYISEFTSSGELALEAQFVSERFVNYRAHKFNFTGLPAEPPALKAFAFGASPESVSTVYYVSWNGATEVASWKFYGAEDASQELTLLGDTQRTGFETIFTSAGYMTQTMAEGVAEDGTSLGNSSIQVTVPPPGWGRTSCQNDNSSDCDALSGSKPNLVSEGDSRSYSLKEASFGSPTASPDRSNDVTEPICGSDLRYYYFALGGITIFLASLIAAVLMICYFRLQRSRDPQPARYSLLTENS